MRIGIVILPEHRWWVAEPKWRAAEELGFHHAWTYDHLGWRTLVDGPWFGAVPTLTAAAMVTNTIRLGTFVASPNFRHPVSFARDVLAVDDVSDGRLVLGIGSGSAVGYDNAVLGAAPLDPAARSARFAEFVELLDTLLRKDHTTWQGEHYAAVDARNLPGCVQRPRVPFVIAANGPKALRLAAAYGTGWVTTGPPTESTVDWWTGVRGLSRRLDALLPAGRTMDRYLNLDSSPEYSLSSVEHFRDVAGRAGELGFTDVIVHWPRSDQPYAGRESVLEAVAADVLPELT